MKKTKDIIGRILFHEQVNIDSKNRVLDTHRKKVLILFTGGTIGMFRNEEGKFAPTRNQFKKFLNKFPYFCDEDETYFNANEGFNITPPSIGEQVIMYKFYELDDLIDSTNMSIDRLNLILGLVEQNYDRNCLLKKIMTPS